MCTFEVIVPYLPEYDLCTVPIEQAQSKPLEGPHDFLNHHPSDQPSAVITLHVINIIYGSRSFQFDLNIFYLKRLHLQKRYGRRTNLFKAFSFSFQFKVV